MGDGTKRGDPTKAGQFGLGFNSVYHVTDVPIFATGPHLVVFDPHQDKGLLGSDAAGAFFDVKKTAGLEDLLRPLTGVFGYDGKGGWSGGAGTLFRLPLRTRATAAKSAIKKQALGVDDVDREVVRPFARDLHRRLLFLRSVETIEVWRDDARVATARLGNVDAALRKKRRAIIDHVRAAMAAASRRRGPAPPVDDEPPRATLYLGRAKLPRESSWQW